MIKAVKSWKDWESSFNYHLKLFKYALVFYEGLLDKPFSKIFNRFFDKS